MKLFIPRWSITNGSKWDSLLVSVSLVFGVECLAQNAVDSKTTIVAYSVLISSYLISFSLVSFVFIEGICGNVHRKNAETGSQLQINSSNHTCGDSIATSFGNCFSCRTLARIWWSIDVCHVPGWSISAKFLSTIPDRYSKYCWFRLVNFFYPRIQIENLHQLLYSQYQPIKEWIQQKDGSDFLCYVDECNQRFSVFLFSRVRQNEKRMIHCKQSKDLISIRHSF